MVTLSSNSLKIVDVNLPDNSKLGEIGVGIANIRIDESDIYINLKDDQVPNISIKRWNKLKNILIFNKYFLINFLIKALLNRF